MISHGEISNRLVNPGLIAVIRMMSSDDVASICEALVTGAVTALEVTTTIPDTLECVR
jgi:2-keto-3-deoxy-6-phosphogluconate aldolase